MSIYLNELLYSWMSWLEDSEFSADNEIDNILKFIKKSEIHEFLTKTEFSFNYTNSKSSPVNFFHPNNYYNSLRTIANFYSNNKYEVVIVDIGGKVCGIDPEGCHRSVKLSRRILSLETNNDLELKVLYQMVIDYNADVLILSNLDVGVKNEFLRIWGT